MIYDDYNDYTMIIVMIIVAMRMMIIYDHTVIQLMLIMTIFLNN